MDEALTELELAADALREAEHGTAGWFVAFNAVAEASERYLDAIRSS